MRIQPQKSTKNPKASQESFASSAFDPGKSLIFAACPHRKAVICLPSVKRRHFFPTATAAALSSGWLESASAAGDFKFRYIVGSSMYGELPLAEILPDVRKTGAESIDIWPRKHGKQREQVAEMGEEKFAAMLKEHGVKL